MKTNAELETLIQNLIERMNRVEATVAHTRRVVAIDPAGAKSAIDAAIVILERTTELYGQQSKEYAHIVDELRDAR